MKEIELTRGLVAIVDDIDFGRLSLSKWFALSCGRWMYAGRKAPREGGKQKTLLMHREIMDVPAGMDVDHINHRTLDNRRDNLRLCTRSQNSQNRLLGSRNTSGLKGVSWDRQKRKWGASGRLAGKTYHLGHFDDPVEAARAYDAFARENFGEFALLNFPDEVE